MTGGDVNGRTWMLLAVLIGSFAGGAVVNYWLRMQGPSSSSAQTGELETLKADVERLKSLVPTQSHAMNDVGYHWASLWYAAQQRNWPLARFFFIEARQHVRWTVLIRPVRRGPDGMPVDIKSIWDGIEPSSFAAVDIAIEQEDPEQFQKDYRVAVETCYACHKAAGLPFLRPMIPTSPPTTIINFAPNPEWPR